MKRKILKLRLRRQQRLRIRHQQQLPKRLRRQLRRQLPPQHRHPRVRMDAPVRIVPAADVRNSAAVADAVAKAEARAKAAAPAALPAGASANFSASGRSAISAPAKLISLTTKKPMRSINLFRTAARFCRAA